MVILDAQKIGPLVRLDAGRFTLMGVFERGVNAVSPQGDVFYLNESCVRGPFNLCVPGFGEVIGRLESGLLVNVNQNEIHIPAGGLTISLHNARRWPTLEKPAVGSPEAIEQAIASVFDRSLQEKLTASEPFLALARQLGWKDARLPDTITAGRLADLTGALRQALMVRDLQAALDPARKCLGLGIGLTPAGDDLLTGLLAGLHLAGDQASFQPQMIESFSKTLIQEGSERTNTLSAAFLRAAGQGEVNEPLRGILDHLISGITISTRALKQLGKTGHTSGYDGLAGALLVFWILVECREASGK